MNHSKTRRSLFSMMAALLVTSACQSQTAEQYEKVTSSDYKINLQLEGRVNFDANGVASGGPVASLSFGGHDVRLTDNMITDGFISTADYGKIMLKGSYQGFELWLTPTQQKKIKELIKS
jgi:predicted component of type VI protein secretion system